MQPIKMEDSAGLDICGRENNKDALLCGGITQLIISSVQDHGGNDDNNDNCYSSLL